MFQDRVTREAEELQEGEDGIDHLDLCLPTSSQEMMGHTNNSIPTRSPATDVDKKDTLPLVAVCALTIGEDI